MKTIIWGMILVFLFFTSCKDEVITPPKTSVLLETDFNSGADNWSAVFAEYPNKDTVFYELDDGIRSLPSPLDTTRKGFMLSGNNHSDALQMFLTRQLSGLNPNTPYSVKVEVELASQYPEGSVGIGGSPGNAVHLVAKFSNLGFTLKEGQDEFENAQLILNKGDSFLEMELGDISIPSEAYIYQLIKRTKTTSQQVKSDNDGKLWAVIGTWSGFEGITTLYYTKIKITLTKM